MTETLYLLWFDPAVEPPAQFALHGDATQMHDGLWLVRSELTRSRLYHRIKWHLPEGTSLLLAPLSDEPDGWPKFKGMAPGALKWLREG